VKVYILGISAFYHDSAACLIKDGEIIAAIEEEKLSRIKHDFSFPKRAITYCLEEAGISANELDYVGFYEKPFLKFERILESYLHYVPHGLSSFLKVIPLWLKQKLLIKDLIRKELPYQGEILFVEHHQAHAASAFFPSPFEKAAFLTMDGVGEWTTTTYGWGEENKIVIQEELKFPHSLGLLYSAFTYYLGFKVNDGEYKVMGLAPYGEPVYADLIEKELIDLKEDGSFRLRMKYFNYPVGLRMTNRRFHRLFNGPPRRPGIRLTQREADLACSIQTVAEKIILRMVEYVKRKTKQENLCLAGGVALNCVACGKVWRSRLYHDLWIQPAAGDAGGALGTALFIWYQYLDNPRKVKEKQDFQKGSFLGPSYKEEEVVKTLEKYKIRYQRISSSEAPEKAARLIAQQKIVGWFQGRVEFGPRALGHRSILADPRFLRSREVINQQVKLRESFRPFAPAILEEYLSEYFELEKKSPYMLLVGLVKEEKRVKIPSEIKGFERLKFSSSQIPAVTHIDYSARIQTVDKEENPLFYRLIKSFHLLTGCPLVLNTSFNRRGEPIVCSPEDAVLCFIKTKMEFLVIENFLVGKS
jgi:carbamoyltransferase